MLGLHNIFLISPPQQPSQPSSTIHQNLNIHHHQDYNNNASDQPNPWNPSSKTQELSGLLKKGPAFGEHGDDASSCRDCGNRAKKECEYRRCRTCCKSRGYDCSTHVKSTWVPASVRRDKKLVGGSGDGESSGGSSSGFGGCKRPRLNHNLTDTSTSNPKATHLVSGLHHQDERFKKSLPGQVRVPAVFRCIKVTPITDGEAEVAYQATVNISGHVFKGLLYDIGTDDGKNVFPCIAKVPLETSTGGRARDSSSPHFDQPPEPFAPSND